MKMCDASGSCSVHIVLTTASTSRIALVSSPKRREAALSAFCSIERIHIQRSIFPLWIALLLVIATSVTSGAEDLELRDLDVASWDCLDRAEGTAKTMDAVERNRMKNRSAENQTAGPIESLDTAAF